MKKYIPNMYKKNILDIDYKKLKEIGIKCLIFDLDNTIALIDEHEIPKNVEELLEDIQLSGFKYWSVEMYYRIVIPLIMRNYDRVLYLDSDIVCKKDISELFATDFDNKKLVAIQDAFNLISTLEIFFSLSIFKIFTLAGFVK